MSFYLLFFPPYFLPHPTTGDKGKEQTSAWCSDAFMALYNYLKGDCSEEGFSLSSQVTNDGMQGNCLRLCQERFRLGIKNFFMERHWQRLPGEMLKSPSLEGFSCVDVSLMHMV